MAKYSKEEMEKAVLAGIIGVIVMVSIYMFVISPQMMALSKIKKEIVTQQDIRTKKRTAIKKAKKRKGNLAKLKKEVESADLLLPKETGYSWFLEQINLWGNTQNIKFDTIVPKENKSPQHLIIDGRNYHSMDMDITLRGGYHQIGKLINKMENYSDSIYIKDISISLEENASESTLVARLTVSLFVLGVN